MRLRLTGVKRRPAPDIGGGALRSARASGCGSLPALRGARFAPVALRAGSGPGARHPAGRATDAQRLRRSRGQGAGLRFAALASLPSLCGRGVGEAHDIPLAEPQTRSGCGEAEGRARARASRRSLRSRRPAGGDGRAAGGGPQCGERPVGCIQGLAQPLQEHRRLSLRIKGDRRGEAGPHDRASTHWRPDRSTRGFRATASAEGPPRLPLRPARAAVDRRARWPHALRS